MWLFDKKKIIFIVVASRCIEFSCFLRRLTPRGTTVIRKRANEIIRREFLSCTCSTPWEAVDEGVPCSACVYRWVGVNGVGLSYGQKD